MNILITGANGFIATHLGNFLEKKSHKIFRIVSKSNNSKNAIVLDLTDSKKVDDFINNFDQKIDVIIHLAAKMANSNHSEIEQIQVFDDNITITKNIARITKKLKPKRLVNFSSMAVYPNIDGKFSEESETKMSQNNDCLYGLAKFCSENIFDFTLNKITNVLHLRISQVYGEGMDQNRIIPIMEQELKKKNTITLFANGKRLSNFIAVSELVKIVDDLIDIDATGIYNVGHESLSYLELAERILKKYGNSKSKIIKKIEGSAPQFYLDTSKLNKKLKNT